MKYATLFSINSTILKDFNNKGSYTPIGTEQLSFNVNIESDDDNNVILAIRKKLEEIRELCENNNE